MSLENKLVDLTVAIEIENFLSGKSDGAALFQQLYGATAGEPIPERLLAVVREQCDPAPATDAAPAPKPALGAALS